MHQIKAEHILQILLRCSTPIQSILIIIMWQRLYQVLLMFIQYQLVEGMRLLLRQQAVERLGQKFSLLQLEVF